jgi:hypothetical protein
MPDSVERTKVFERGEPGSISVQTSEARETMFKEVFAGLRMVCFAGCPGQSSPLNPPPPVGSLGWGFRMSMRGKGGLGGIPQVVRLYIQGLRTELTVSYRK